MTQHLPAATAFAAAADQSLSDLDAATLAPAVAPASAPAAQAATVIDAAVAADQTPVTPLAQPAAALAPVAQADVAPDAPDAPAAAQPWAPNGFTAMGLAAPLLDAVRDLGYTEPMLVQSRTIPLALQGLTATAEAPDAQQRYHDLLVCSQTGSGKTAAFLLPLLHRLIGLQQAAQEAERLAAQRAQDEATARGEPAPKRPRRRNPVDPRSWRAAQPGVLVLCPTRELAQQVANDAIDLARHARGLRVATIVGGVPYPVQISRLQNANLVVATPGRLLDLQRSGQIVLDDVQALVVDEADRMLDLGFADDLAEIHNLTAARQQTLMFSATLAPRIQQLALRVMHEGGAHVQRVEIASPQERHANIRQVLFWADHPAHKRALLDHWLRDATIDQAIVFVSTQIECDELSADLQQAGFAAVGLHGALSQGLRNRRLNALRNGQVQILVATDVAARGIDVPAITHVFNYGLPMKAEDYTHRIGRTGRAGRDGVAVTFAEGRDCRRLSAIEGFTRQRFLTEVVPGLEPRQRIPDLHAAPGRGRFSEHRGAPRRWGNDGPDNRGPGRGAPGGRPEGGAGWGGRAPAAPAWAAERPARGAAPSARPDWRAQPDRPFAARVDRTDAAPRRPAEGKPFAGRRDTTWADAAPRGQAPAGRPFDGPRADRDGPRRPPRFADHKPTGPRAAQARGR